MSWNPQPTNEREGRYSCVWDSTETRERLGTGEDRLCGFGRGKARASRARHVVRGPASYEDGARPYLTAQNEAAH